MTSFSFVPLLSVGATVRWAQTSAQIMKGTRGWSTSPYFQVRRRLGVKNTIETESCAEGGSVPCLAW